MKMGQRHGLSELIAFSFLSIELECPVFSAVTNCFGSCVTITLLLFFDEVVLTRLGTSLFP